MSLAGYENSCGGELISKNLRVLQPVYHSQAINEEEVTHRLSESSPENPELLLNKSTFVDKIERGECMLFPN